MDKLFFHLRIAAICIMMACVNGALAQSKETVRQAINQWGECRNVALTESKGDLALYGENGYILKDCPKDLNDAVTKLYADKEYIDDIQLTEGGRWLILYGENGFLWNEIPESLEAKLKEMNEKAEVITSVTFNDLGEWIVIGPNYFAASNEKIEKMLEEGNEKYGKIWAACITSDAIAVVFEDGYKYAGDIPKSLEKALDETKLDVYRLKFSGSSWFLANKDGKFECKM